MTHEAPLDLAARVQALEVLTGFQERLIGQLHDELLAHARQLQRLEGELRRLQEGRQEEGAAQEPLDEEDRVPSCG
ncbi:MAG: SlyX family protein [Planctomycetes bacterium]|nr:SlyX family protein [Planctomycetota bacterium]